MGLFQMRNLVPRGVDRFLARRWYEYLSRLDQGAEMVFMNYGWSDQNGAPELPLEEEDESNRYCIQLYNRVASAVDLEGRKVLEVGSGRGGGASYVARYLKPASMVGLDITSSAIRFCRRHYDDVKNLEFVRGDAQALPFAPATFDAVVNVESSHCYASMEAFLGSVHRVLVPGGHFLFADHRLQEEIEGLREQIEKAQFVILKEERITANVLQALDDDNDRKSQLIERKVPKVFQGLFKEFAGIQGTRGIYKRFETRDDEYLRYVLQKVA